MKRNPALQSLSREHHTALVLAKTCERVAQSGDEELIQQTCLRAIQIFSNEMEPHFQIEEQTYLPLLRGTQTQQLVEQTRADHQELRELANGLQQNNVEALASFGKCLSAHVRFEERELFPAIEGFLQRKSGSSLV